MSEREQGKGREMWRWSTFNIGFSSCWLLDSLIDHSWFGVCAAMTILLATVVLIVEENR